MLIDLKYKMTDLIFGILYLITSYCPQTAAEVGFRLLESMISTEDMNGVKEARGVLKSIIL